VFADYQTGNDAYMKGDYATALKEYRAAAAQGNVEAHHNLGLMYEKGEGVTQDFN
jgi:TPR repeat protein